VEPDEIVVRGVAVERRLPWLARRDQTTLRVTRVGVHLGEADTARFVPRESMRRVYVVSDDLHVTLVIEVGWERVLLKLPWSVDGALATARRCVERLEMAPHQRVLVFRDFVSRARWITTIVAGVPFGVIVALGVRAVVQTELPHALLWAVGALVMWAISLVVRTADVAVGADGVELRGPWRSRFISFATLDGVSLTVPGNELEVREVGGAAKRYGWTAAVDDEGWSGFALALGWARERYAERRRESELAPLLARGDRTLAAWRSSLHELAQGGPTYRASALDGDEVARLLDDPSVEGESRVGAALVLREVQPAGAPTRVRVAAEACAHAPTREALEAVAAGTLDDAALVALARGRRS